MDIRFCHFEELLIWNNRFFNIKNNGFQMLIENMNFGKVAHYCWRLEFQERGAPHVHALIWVEDRLSLEQIGKSFFANIPDDRTPILRS